MVGANFGEDQSGLHGLPDRDRHLTTVRQADDGRTAAFATGAQAEQGQGAARGRRGLGQGALSTDPEERIESGAGLKGRNEERGGRRGRRRRCGRRRGRQPAHRPDLRRDQSSDGRAAQGAGAIEPDDANGPGSPPLGQRQRRETPGLVL